MQHSFFHFPPFEKKKNLEKFVFLHFSVTFGILESQTTES